MLRTMIKNKLYVTIQKYENRMKKKKKRQNTWKIELKLLFEEYSDGIQMKRWNSVRDDALEKHVRALGHDEICFESLRLMLHL